MADILDQLGIKQVTKSASPIPATKDVLDELGISDQDIVKSNAESVDPMTGQVIDPQAGQRITAGALGAIQGASDAFAGPIQAALGFISPDLAKQFTEFVNTPDVVTQAQGQPGFSTGQVLGNIGTTVLQGRALARGATALAPQIPAAIAKIPAPIRDAIFGGTLGATQFYQNPENADRLKDALLGSAGGTIGGQVARSAAAGVTKIVNAIGIDKYLKTLVDSVKSLEPHTSALKQKIEGNFDRLNKIKTEKYDLRDAAGDKLGPQPSEPIYNALDELEAKLKKSTVSNRIGATVSKVREILSSDSESGAVKAGGVELDPNNPIHSILLQRLKEQGIGPKAEEIEPSQLFNALTEVNKQLKSTKDVAKIRQLKDLRNTLYDEVKTIANKAGKKPEDLIALHEEANKFFKENIIPFRKMFGVNPDSLTANLSHKDVYDKSVSILESKDPEKIANFIKIVGPSGQNDLKMVLIKKALENAVTKDGKFNPGAVQKYLFDNKLAMDKLSTPGEKNQLIGFSNMLNAAAKAGKEPKFHTPAPSILLFIGLEHAMRGSIESGAELAGSGIAAYGAAKTFNALLGSRVGRTLLAAASHTNPDSPKMVSLIEQTAAILGKRAGVAAEPAIAP